MKAEHSSKAMAQAQAFLGVRFSFYVPVAFFSFTAKTVFYAQSLVNPSPLQSERCRMAVR
jgi:hypothetical protein